MSSLVRIIAVLVFAGYPLIVYFGLTHFEPRYLGIAIALIFVLRFFSLRQKIDKEQMLGFVPLLISGVICGLIAAFMNTSSYLTLIPFLMNAVFFINFAYTLFKPPSMIERFARLTDADLPLSAVSYTRNVTVVWCLFFLLNASIAFYTAVYEPIQVWALYNGLIAYALVGLLFAIEYIVRIFVRNRSAG